MHGHRTGVSVREHACASDGEPPRTPRTPRRKDPGFARARVPRSCSRNANRRGAEAAEPKDRIRLCRAPVCWAKPKRSLLCGLCPSAVIVLGHTPDRRSRNLLCLGVLGVLGGSDSGAHAVPCTQCPCTQRPCTQPPRAAYERITRKIACAVATGVLRSDCHASMRTLVTRRPCRVMMPRAWVSTGPPERR